MSETAGSKEVVAAVIRRGDFYLLCQVPPGKRNELLWEFPGGKKEKGESDHDAVLRELREELDVQVTQTGERILVVSDEKSGFTICFIPTEIEGEPRAVEHVQLIWMAPIEAYSLSLASSDNQMIEYLLQNN